MTGDEIGVGRQPDALKTVQMVEVIIVARVGKTWAVQHRGSYLGHTKSLEEATSIGEDLVSWLETQGRQARLVLGEPSSCAGLKSDERA